MGFAADKGLRVKQGDRLVFIVLPGEGADSGVKGAIKVEWVRKGDLLEQMKKKWGAGGAGIDRRFGQEEMAAWRTEEASTCGCTIEAQTVFVFLFMKAII